MSDSVGRMSTTDHTREALARILSKSRAPNWWDGDEPATFDDDQPYNVPDEEDYSAADAILASPWLAAHVAAVVGGKDAEIQRLRQAGEVVRSEREEAQRRLSAVAAIADAWAAAGATPPYKSPLEMQHMLRAVLPDAMRLPARRGGRRR